MHFTFKLTQKNKNDCSLRNVPRKKCSDDKKTIATITRDIKQKKSR